MLTISNPNTFDWANMPLVDCCEGNAYDTHYTLRLYHLLQGVLDEQDLMPLVNHMISPALTLLADMEYRGIDVSREELGVVGRELSLEVIEAEDEMFVHQAVKTTDNLSSTKDLVEILYTREGGLELYPPDRTSKGNPSTAAPVLKTLLLQIEEELTTRGK